MKLLATLLLSLSLSGCAIFGPAPQLAVPTNLSEAGREAAKLINESKVDLISVSNTIESQAKAGLLLKTEAKNLSNAVDMYWDRVKAAEALLNKGQDLAAQDQARLLQVVIIELQKQVIARGRK